MTLNASSGSKTNMLNHGNSTTQALLAYLGFAGNGYFSRCLITLLCSLWLCTAWPKKTEQVRQVQHQQTLGRKGRQVSGFLGIFFRWSAWRNRYRITVLHPETLTSHEPEKQCFCTRSFLSFKDFRCPWKMVAIYKVQSRLGVHAR